MEHGRAKIRIADSENSDSEPEENPNEANLADGVKLPGVVAELGELKEGAVIFEVGLAHLFKRHAVSIKRAVERGEIPPPCRLFGRSAWTVGAILRHLEGRQEQATEERADLEKKIARLSP